MVSNGQRDLNAHLSAQTESLNQGAVTLDVALLHVAEQATTLTHEHGQRASRGMVFVILLEVLSEVSNAIGEQRHLTFHRTRVLRILAVLLEDFGLLCFV